MNDNDLVNGHRGCGMRVGEVDWSSSSTVGSRVVGLSASVPVPGRFFARDSTSVGLDTGDGSLDKVTIASSLSSSAPS